MLRHGLLVSALAVILGGMPALAAAEPFALTSASFRDGDAVPADQAASGNDPAGKPCGGKNIAPALNWSGVPERTQSFAVTMVDIDARRGAGVTQWLLYNIPASVTSLALGEGNRAVYTAGKNVYGQTTYLGPCTGIGDSPHHYVISIFALDQPPELPAGLDRDALMHAIQPHVVRESSLVGHFART